MHFLHCLIFLLLLSFQVLSAPSSQVQAENKSFVIERRRRADYIAHGPTALRRAFEKHNITSTTHSSNHTGLAPLRMRYAVQSDNELSSKSDKTGLVSALSAPNHVEFVSSVTIGGQKLDMDFDTGSADFWVISADTPGAVGSRRSVFYPSKSPTFKFIENATFGVEYSDFSYASGQVGIDTVDIGGVTVNNQSIGIPRELSESFTADKSSNGIVGLAFKSLNTVVPVQQDTLFGNIAPMLAEPVLTARLRFNGAGEYEFGAIDHTKYQGTLFNISVDPSLGYWMFSSTTFAIGSGPLQTIETSTSAIADTGTTLMLLSPEVVEAYYDSVPGAVLDNEIGGFIYPCSASLPDLTVDVGGTKVVISGAMLNFSAVGVSAAAGEEFCFGGVQSNKGIALQIFGDVFLRMLFVVFDMRGPSLGIAVPA